jgi:hypothetical protein
MFSCRQFQYSGRSPANEKAQRIRHQHNFLLLRAVELDGCAAESYSVLELDLFIARTLIVILAKRYDPNYPLIGSDMLHMRPDFYVAAAVLRTAFVREFQSGPPFPMTKPGLASSRALTLTAGRSINVDYFLAHGSASY